MSPVPNGPDTFVEENPPRDQPVDAPALWQNFPSDARQGLPTSSIAWSETLPGGSHWSWSLRRGTAVRFVALDAGVNVSLVLYAAHDKLERYCMPDSLKAQHTAHYTRGHVLMSDMGRAMASFIADSLGWHDPLGGLLDNERMVARYGEHRYQDFRNGMYRSGTDGLLIELGKHGLGRRDLIAPVNLFTKLDVDAQGRFQHASAHAKAGDHVDLRFDMDVIACLSTAPHPLDVAPHYRPGRVGMAAWHCGAAAADDACRAFRAENARAMHNTDLFYL